MTAIGIGVFAPKVAFYPALGRVLGVKATVLLCCVLHWQELTEHEFGAEKSAADIEREIGLTYEEQRTARRVLREAGLLIETERRLEHKMYYRVELKALTEFARKASS